MPWTWEGSREKGVAGEGRRDGRHPCASWVATEDGAAELAPHPHPPCRILATCQGLSHERLVGTGRGENGKRWEVEVGHKSGHKGDRGVSTE